MVFYRFYNILETQESTSIKRSPIDISIYNLILSLEITVFKLKETRFIPWKPIHIFSLSKIVKNII